MGVQSFIEFIEKIVPKLNSLFSLQNLKMFESDSDSDEEVVAPVATPAPVPAPASTPVVEEPKKRKYTKKPMTDEQKKALVERLAKAREAKKQKASKPAPTPVVTAPVVTAPTPTPKQKPKKEKVVQEIHNHFYNHPPASEKPSAPPKPPGRYANATW